MSDSEYDDMPSLEIDPIIRNHPPRGVGNDIIIMEEEIEEPFKSVLAAMHLGKKNDVPYHSIASESARRNSEHLLDICIKEEEEKLVTVIDETNFSDAFYRSIVPIMTKEEMDFLCPLAPDDPSNKLR